MTFPNIYQKLRETKLTWFWPYFDRAMVETRTLPLPANERKVAFR